MASTVDGVVVPMAQPVVTTLGSGGAAAANVACLLVHPAVAAACQRLVACLPRWHRSASRPTETRLPGWRVPCERPYPLLDAPA
jgi:hypothetical protein